MYLIDETYFVMDLNVPNKVQSLDIPVDEKPLEFYIDKYARQLLQNALGNVLFDELDDYVDGVELKEDTPEKWSDLVNGKSYTYNDKDYKWKGLIFTEGAFKGSLLANYSFYHWHINKISRMSGLGEVKGNAVNSVNVNSTRKSVKVWNDYLEMYQGFYENNTYTYSEVKGVPFHDYYNPNINDYVSLITYLKHNEETYPDARLKLETDGYKNTFGL